MTETDLRTLKHRWLATGSFRDELAYLAARVWLNNVRFVYLDPDGTLPEWIGIVVRRETGVVYGTQCAGVATEQRFIDGYFIPVGGLKYDIDEGNLFVDVFHENGSCQWDWTGGTLPPERRALLSNLVGSIPYWRIRLDGADRKDLLRIDATFLEQLAEAWIPVQTPDGPGVLLYRNCD